MLKTSTKLRHSISTLERLRQKAFEGKRVTYEEIDEVRARFEKCHSDVCEIETKLASGEQW